MDEEQDTTTIAGTYNRSNGPVEINYRRPTMSPFQQMKMTRDTRNKNCLNK